MNFSYNFEGVVIGLVEAPWWVGCERVFSDPDRITFISFSSFDEVAFFFSFFFFFVFVFVGLGEAVR